MITRPLELESRMSPPPRDLDFVAWVNVGVIVLFFGLFGSNFVLAPGLPVGMGNTGTLVLPSVGSGSQGAGPVSVVVILRSENLMVFDDGKYSLSELRKPMEAYVQKHPGAVMLVVAGKQVSVQAFADLSELAYSVGFANVILAGDKPASQSPRN